MKRAVVEKRADAVIRWLERLKKSYSSGAVETAFMDAECARADLENLRHDVLMKLPVIQVNKTGGAVKFLRIAFLACIIVMTMLSPVSRDIVNHESDNPVISEPIIVISEYEAEKPQNQNQAQKQAKTQAVSRPRKNQPQTAKQTERPLKAEKPQKPEKPEKLEKHEKTVAYDKVYSLLQTGRRALSDNNSVIKVK